MKRAAQPLHGDYTSSPLPDQRRLIDTLFNLQGTKGEARGRWAGGESRVVRVSVSLVFASTEQGKGFVEKGGQATRTNDRLLWTPLCTCSGRDNTG